MFYLTKVNQWEKKKGKLFYKIWHPVKKLVSTFKDF